MSRLKQRVTPPRSTISDRSVAEPRRVRTGEPDGHTEPERRTCFALVIPALNEEEAIGATLERALAAREDVVANTPIDEMAVVFVNDGSTDGTQAIADEYPDVIKIHFEKNRGYGAAIKAGFHATEAELVGFMDADGTCDPRFCTELLNRMYETDADVVLGSRLNPDSEMPPVRRLGNWIFARLIGVVSGQSLTDSASGMRVIRRKSLRRMVPLPDGLHFTPAMSCVATLDPRMRIEEVPMPYKERIGPSKLSAVKDGVKFLAIILFAASCYRPISVLSSLGLLFCIFGAVVCSVTSVFGAGRPVIIALGAAFLFVFLQAVFIGLLCHQLNYMLMGPRVIAGKGERLLQKLCWTKPMVIAGIAYLAVGLALCLGACVWSAPWREYLWIASAGCIALAGWCALGGIILRVIWAAREKQKAEWEDPFEQRAPGQQSTIAQEGMSSGSSLPYTQSD